jgi:hypothetical protein
MVATIGTPFESFVVLILPSICGLAAFITTVASARYAAG